LAPTDPDHAERAQALLGQFAGPLSELGVRSPDQAHAIRALRAAVHGFVVLERNGQFTMSADVDESFSRLVDLMIDGLRRDEP